MYPMNYSFPFFFNLKQLSEMTVDLAEERSTANIATERLEAETGERLRLEKELTEKESKVKSLQESTEKLEMELICARSDLNGISEEDEELENDENGAAGSIYKLKYERVAKELEFTKRRLQTQHEHDLEQLIGLKKQLEKKVKTIQISFTCHLSKLSGCARARPLFSKCCF